MLIYKNSVELFFQISMFVRFSTDFSLVFKLSNMYAKKHSKVGRNSEHVKIISRYFGKLGAYLLHKANMVSLNIYV